MMYRQGCFVLLCCFACSGISFGFTLAEYDAAKVNPAENPVNQGWSESGIVTGVTVEGVYNSGMPAWRILDNSSNNPWYQVSLTSDDLQKMYQYGWQYSIVVKAVLGSQFTGWGLSTANDPGWGLTSQERVGFTIANVNGAFKVTPIHGSAITLGAGSADGFHTIRCVGAKQSSQYEFILDGVSRGSFDIKDGTSNNSNDNLVGFMSGSSSGTGLEAYWNYAALLYNDPLIFITESEDDTNVTEGDSAGDSYEVFVTGSPAEPVTVAVIAPGQVLVNGQSQAHLIFTPPVDPAVLQTVTVTAIDDTVSEGTHYVNLTHTSSSNAAAYDNVVLDDVQVRITDNESSAIKVFLIGGQSNAAGSGANADYDAIYQIPQYDVEFWVGGRIPGDGVPDYSWDRSASTSFGPLQLGSGNFVGGTSSGFEMSLGRKLKDAMPGENIAIIKYGMSGSALNRGQRNEGAGDWDSDPAPLNGSFEAVRYHVFMNSAVLPALQSITDRGDTYEVAGMFWMQGETDAGSSTAANAYYANLKKLIQSLRSETNTPDMPFFIGRLHDNTSRSYLNIVRDAMEQVAAEDDNAYYIDTDNFALNSDNLHFSAAGQTEMGNVFADEWLLNEGITNDCVVYEEDFESYDVANPTDFSIDGVAAGNWTSSNTAANATRIFDTGNFGGTRLWISLVDSASITSAAIDVTSNTDYIFSAMFVCETSSSTRTGQASYDLRVGQDAASATSIISGPVTVTTHGDDWDIANSKDDHFFAEKFKTGDLNASDKLFIVITRISSGAWVGADDLSIRYDFAGDIDDDCDVDLKDFAILANQWLNVDCGTCDGADLVDGDGDVTIDDLRVFTESWLMDWMHYSN